MHETGLCEGRLAARSGGTPGLARGRAGRGPARRAELRVNPRGLPREFLIARRADPPPTLLEPPYTSPKGRLVGVRTGSGKAQWGWLRRAIRNSQVGPGGKTVSGSKPSVAVPLQAAFFSSSSEVSSALAGMPFFHGRSTGYSRSRQ